MNNKLGDLINKYFDLKVAKGVGTMAAATIILSVVPMFSSQRLMVYLFVAAIIIPWASKPRKKTGEEDD